MITIAHRYLDRLNKEYFKLHRAYEELFWLSYMGDHSVNKQMAAALAKRDAFRANPKYTAKLQELLGDADRSTKKRLEVWLDFFGCYQTPAVALPIKEKINKLEADLQKKQAERKEGYLDPKTKKFVVASTVKMATMIATHDDERVRRACFEAREKLALSFVKEYVVLVGLRNKYAQALGYSDFYDFKVRREDGMTKKELFGVFDNIYRQTKFAFKDLRQLEKKMLGLRQPWNFGYLMAGDFTKEEDPYFQFSDALWRWGRSFASLGIDYHDGRLNLDLIDRKGKYNNGFCHWPDLVRFQNGRRFPGSSNFTCNVVLGQVGSGHQGFDTLFHEGGHAAHLLNSEQVDVCLNSEYAPASTSWAETQSMFLDTLFSGIDWATRYAKNDKGESYPFDLFERKVKKLQPLRPLNLNGIIFVSNFEKEIYETKDLTEEKVLVLARSNYKKYYDRAEDSLTVLNVPHIYSWESSASYHGYGLATLALDQWREYFYQKYGYIVDNPKVGEEMAKVWKLGAAKKFNEFVLLATKKKLSAEAFLRLVTATADETINLAKKKIQRLAKVKISNQPVKLNARIKMVHGRKEIANNQKSFEAMAKKYSQWLEAGAK